VLTGIEPDPLPASRRFYFIQKGLLCIKPRKLVIGGSPSIGSNVEISSTLFDLKIWLLAPDWKLSCRSAFPELIQLPFNLNQSYFLDYPCRFPKAVIETAGNDITSLRSSSRFQSHFTEHWSILRFGNCLSNNLQRIVCLPKNHRLVEVISTVYISRRIPKISAAVCSRSVWSLRRSDELCFVTFEHVAK